MSTKKSNGQPKSRLLKVVLLGDGGVGKSSLMNRFVSNKFDSQSFHTIGVEFLNKDIKVAGENFTLQIWDTAGQERFKSLRTPFYRGADCCLLTFGVDDAASFKNLGMWKKEFLYYADVQDPLHFPFVALGNKIDLASSSSSMAMGDISTGRTDAREVSEEEAKRWCAAEDGMPYYETSAKDAINVREAYEAAVRRVIEIETRLDNRRVHHADTVDLSKRQQKSSCC